MLSDWFSAKRRSKNRNQPYAKYLRTDHWKSFRAKVLDQRGMKCSECGIAKKIQVHHLHYRNLGHELMSDVEVLCKTCHQKRHGVKRFRR